MKIMKKVTLQLCLLFAITASAICNESGTLVKPDSIIHREIREIVVVDSAIYKMLDSVIKYEKHCHRRNTNLITHYSVNARVEKSNGNNVFRYSVYSSIDGDLLGFSDKDSIGILIYKDRYFFFRISDIKNMHKYIQPSKKTGYLEIQKKEWREIIIGGKIDSELINIRNKKKINLGKTYMIVDVEIDKDKVEVYGNYWCMCHYNKLSRLSRFLSLKKFIYDVFCPCRASKRL
jgi:hypothetical protein